MRLSYSRLDYYKEVFDQKVEPFIRCHINAFEYFAKAEKAKVLRILPTDEFVIPLMIRREAYRDCHVYINYNYYSTPYQYVGKTIEIELKKGLVYIL